MHRRAFLATLAGLFGGLMTAWSKPMTWVASRAVTSTQMNLVRDNLKNLDERLTLHGITSESALNKVKSAVCGVRLRDSGTQNIADESDSTLNWDTEDLDTDGFHDAGLPARITIPTGLGGYYLVSVGIRWDGTFATFVRLWVEDSAGAILGRDDVLGSNAAFSTQTLTFLAPLDAGDYIIARVRHSEGGTETVTKSQPFTFFSAYRLFAT